MGEKDTRLVVDQIDLTGGMAIDARIRSVEAYGLMLALAFWVTGSLPTGITAKQLVDLMTACNNAQKRLRKDEGG